MAERLEMSPGKMIEALKNEVWLRDTEIGRLDKEVASLRDEIERLRDERLQMAFKIIEDEARLSKARRYVVRVDGTKENSDA